MRTTAELREGFQRFYEERGHLRVPSHSLIPPADDPSTLFIVAGMQQFKPYFLGLREPPAQARRQRPEGAARRRQGHRPRGRRPHRPPLLVLRDARQLLVRRLLQGRGGRLRLGVRHEAHGPRPRTPLGDRARGQPGARARRGHRRDRGLEARRDARRTGSCGSARTTSGRPPTPGPCGPCSEIFLDRGEEHGCGRDDCRPGCECDRYMEFYNLVFMEFDLRPGPELVPLPNQNVDTGLGVERGACLLQEVGSVFDTDGFRLIMDWVERESGVAYGDDPAGDEGAPRPRRPRPRDVVPDRRRRHAVERGPRLHLPPHHPPRRAARPADRPRPRLPARRRSSRADGRRLSRAARARGRDRARRPARGGALPRDARARPEGLRRARRAGRDLRRGRVRARDDVRLPDRAHAGARRGARPGRRHRPLPRR